MFRSLLILVFSCINFVSPSEANERKLATIFYKEAIKAGERGKFPKALKLFSKANLADPNWEEPIFQSAVTHLYMENASKALECYKKVKCLPI